MMAVPILRTGKVAGVLAVQNQASRHYSEEEEEALQTVAMVLAELVVSGDLITSQEQNDGNMDRAVISRFKGTVFAEGLAEGVVVMHEPRVEITQHLSEDYEHQQENLVRFGLLSFGVYATESQKKLLKLKPVMCFKTRNK